MTSFRKIGAVGLKTTRFKNWDPIGAEKDPGFGSDYDYARRNVDGNGKTGSKEFDRFEETSKRRRANGHPEKTVSEIDKHPENVDTKSLGSGKCISSQHISDSDDKSKKAKISHEKFITNISDDDDDVFPGPSYEGHDLSTKDEEELRKHVEKFMKGFRRKGAPESLERIRKRYMRPGPIPPRFCPSNVDDISISSSSADTTDEIKKEKSRVRCVDEQPEKAALLSEKKCVGVKNVTRKSKSSQ